MNSFLAIFSSLQFTSTDVFTLVPIIVLVIFLLVLSNSEFKKSLEQSRKAQELLVKDRDILKQELNESRAARLHELSRAAEFGRLSQGIFHDLMTPLTSMILHTEKLQEDVTVRRHIEKAIEASGRMAEYVKDIRRTLSRESVERECSPNEELASVLHLLEYKSKEKRVAVYKESSSEFTWYGNPFKLRQVFSNLINNALDAFDGTDMHQEKRVGILLATRSKNIIFKVTDNGTGISSDHVQKIFDPFFTTKAADKGTGIGLTTVKSIVEKDFKGTVTVKSELGKGTEFEVIFPLQYTNPDASRLPPRTPLRPE